MVVQQPQVQPQVQQVQPQVQQQTAVPTAQASQIVGSGVQVRAFAVKGLHSCWQVPVHLSMELGVRYPTVRDLVASGAVWEPVSSRWPARSYLSPPTSLQTPSIFPFPPSLRTCVGEDGSVVSASPPLGAQGRQSVYGGALETEGLQNDGTRCQQTAQACAAARRPAGCRDWPSVLRGITEALQAHPLCTQCRWGRVGLAWPFLVEARFLLVFGVGDRASWFFHRSHPPPPPLAGAKERRCLVWGLGSFCLHLAVGTLAQERVLALDERTC